MPSYQDLTEKVWPLYLQNQTIEFKCKYQVCIKSQVVIKIWSMNTI